MIKKKTFIDHAAIDDALFGLQPSDDGSDTTVDVNPEVSDDSGDSGPSDDVSGDDDANDANEDFALIADGSSVSTDAGDDVIWFRQSYDGDLGRLVSATLDAGVGADQVIVAGAVQAIDLGGDKDADELVLDLAMLDLSHMATVKHFDQEIDHITIANADATKIEQRDTDAGIAISVDGHDVALLTNVHAHVTIDIPA